ncbi:hypothetical protein TetV_326 [Tetraselmis virus 1]|uniref:Uncharacterized protein n=1 Tax=Tetraselmis virus 1 TaxID=2060617 RepID=A0A2P0VND9_9VIRU|nr:hypothetical protein QJ968_gp326 [Tetraselmis virus 1]AUF82418.1 hypothetical protein TetV_326 [Tetraselmis virus 1]
MSLSSDKYHQDLFEKIYLPAKKEVFNYFTEKPNTLVFIYFGEINSFIKIQPSYNLTKIKEAIKKEYKNLEIDFKLKLKDNYYEVYLKEVTKQYRIFPPLFVVIPIIASEFKKLNFDDKGELYYILMKQHKMLSDPTDEIWNDEERLNNKIEIMNDLTEKIEIPDNYKMQPSKPLGNKTLFDAAIREGWVFVGHQAVKRITEVAYEKMPMMMEYPNEFVVANVRSAISLLNKRGFITKINREPLARVGSKLSATVHTPKGDKLAIIHQDKACSAFNLYKDSIKIGNPDLVLSYLYSRYFLSDKSPDVAVLINMMIDRLERARMNKGLVRRGGFDCI